LASLLDIEEATFKWLGIGSTLFGLIWIVFGIVMLRTPGQAEYGYETLGVCSPLFLIAGVLVLHAGLVQQRRMDEFRKLAAYLKAYRRIKISDLAVKMKLSEYETERSIVKCVRYHMLTGYIDRASDEFFNPEGAEGKALITCPNCGGSVEEMVLSGESGKCPYCDSLLAGNE
jgi:hypothetical protein